MVNLVNHNDRFCRRRIVFNLFIDMNEGMRRPVSWHIRRSMGFGIFQLRGSITGPPDEAWVGAGAFR